MSPFAVLHVPHSSRFIPAEIRPAILLSDEDLATELLRMTDAYTDELFRLDPRLARMVTSPVSRLVVDPERFPDDAVESMASRGMGAIYTRTSDGSPLRTRREGASRSPGRALRAASSTPRRCRGRGARRLARGARRRLSQLPVRPASLRNGSTAAATGDLHRHRSLPLACLAGDSGNRSVQGRRVRDGDRSSILGRPGS